MSNRNVLAPLGVFLIALAPATIGCGTDKSGSQESQAQSAVKSQITAELVIWYNAAVALRAAAPTPDADGWNDQADAAAVNAMKTQWAGTRDAYERIEGAIAVLFPDYDVSTDERYDGFLSDTGPDNDLFDEHGRHRRPRHRAHPVGRPRARRRGRVRSGAARLRRRQLPHQHDSGDRVPRRSGDAPGDRRAGCADDVRAVDARHRGGVPRRDRLDQEQVEKTTLAADGEDESRYAQHTLADMRSNLAGGMNTYDAFRDWVRSEAGGTALDTDILAGFDRVSALYARSAATRCRRCRPASTRTRRRPTSWRRLTGRSSRASRPRAPPTIRTRWCRR